LGVWGLGGVVWLGLGGGGGGGGGGGWRSVPANFGGKDQQLNSATKTDFEDLEKSRGSKEKTPAVRRNQKRNMIRRTLRGVQAKVVFGAAKS